jgi:flagellar FliL protein
MTKKKLIIIVAVALVAVVGGWKFVFAKEAESKPTKIHGDVYVLGKDFLVNLAGGHYAKLGVAIVVDHGAAAPAGGGGHGAAAPKPPEGYGPLPQEAAVRDIITDELTGADADALIDRPGRASLKKRIVKAIEHDTDVKVDEVLFTDVAVQ